MAFNNLIFFGFTRQGEEGNIIFPHKAKMNKDQILEKLKNSSEEIRAFGVDKLYVFGSILRDDFNDESDIDFLVDFLPNQKTPDNYFGLYVHFEEEFKRDIDLVTRLALEPKMENRVYSTMQQVY